MQNKCVLIYVLTFLVSIDAETALEFQCQNCQELLLSLLRKSSEINFPTISFEDELLECHKKENIAAKTHSSSIQALLLETRRVKATLDNDTEKSLTNQSEINKIIDDKMLSNQKLRQSLVTKELNLSTKFDCQEKAISSSQCQPFCIFWCSRYIKHLEKHLNFLIRLESQGLYAQSRRQKGLLSIKGLSERGCDLYVSPRLWKYLNNYHYRDNT